MIPAKEMAVYAQNCKAMTQGDHLISLVDALIKASASYLFIRVEPDANSDEKILFSFDGQTETIDVPLAITRMRQICARLSKVLSDNVAKKFDILGDELDADIPTDNGYVAQLHVRFQNTQGSYFVEMRNRSKP